MTEASRLTKPFLHVTSAFEDNTIAWQEVSGLSLSLSSSYSIGRECC